MNRLNNNFGLEILPSSLRHREDIKELMISQIKIYVYLSTFVSN